MAGDTGFDITEYRDMWLDLSRQVEDLRAGNQTRALRAKDMSELSRFQGIDEGLALTASLLAQVEDAHGVNPRGRPAFQQQENTDG